MIYIPIDMSLDMLVNGAKAASRRLLAPGQVIPLQIDFSSPTELAMVVEIRNQVLRGQPMLFSLLGNTLANFEDDLTTLRTLTDVMQDGDVLLLELATTREAGPTIVDMAVREYRNIPSFESFVRSALTQHTDLPTNEIEYEGSTCHDGGALQIDMNYVSVGESTGRLIDGSEIVLTPGEKIRLYRSRKYTLATIRHLLEQAGLREHGCFEHWNDRRNSPFGLYLGICRR